MYPIVRDLNPSRLVRALEDNLLALLRFFALFPHAELLDAPDVLRVITGYAFPFANGISRARMAPDYVDQQIEIALEPLRQRRLPALWWVLPSSQPANLGKRLVSHGLEGPDVSPGMAIDLNLINRNAPRPDGLVIRRVTGSELVQDYRTAMLAGFDLGSVAGELVEQVIAIAGFNDSALWRSFVGYLEGVPVATCSVWWGGGVAGLYNVSTVSSVRGRGIGGAMTLAGLDDAIAHGYRVAVLEASTKGTSVYARLGFAEYCTIETYLLPA